MEKENEIETLFNNEWLSLKKIGNYVYSSETRCKGEIVVVLVHNNDGEILGRFEDTPSHNPGKRNVKLVSLTGGVEADLGPRKTALLELKEEAGLKAKNSELRYLGKVRPSKSADTTVYLFALNGTGKIFGEAKGDGSEGEQGAYCKWVKTERALTSEDPLLPTAIARKGLIDSGLLSTNPEGPR